MTAPNERRAFGVALDFIGDLKLSELLAIVWLTGLVAAAICLPPLMNLDPLEFSANRLESPSTEALFGYDELGRDVFARAIFGARVSLRVGIISVVVAAVVGVPFGLLSGYLRGKVDRAVSFLVEVVQGFPALVLALMLAGLLGASEQNVIIAIAVVSIPAFVRIARAQTLARRNENYVTAAKVAGASVPRILLREVLPNIRDSVTAFGLAMAGTAMIIEGSLSFLGVGVPLPEASWGGMIQSGRSWLDQAPHLVYVPAVFLALTILSFNLLSDRLRNDVHEEGLTL